MGEYLDYITLFLSLFFELFETFVSDVGCVDITFCRYFSFLKSYPTLSVNFDIVMVDVD
jgi:hypothetical protein